MFKKDQVDALIAEMRQEFEGTSGWEKLIRDVHLGVALLDAGRPLNTDLDPRAVALIEKHKPAE